MQMVAEEFSSAGIPVIPHLNALTTSDWDYWATLLRDQPHIHWIAKEFQTGLSIEKQGLDAIRALSRLQERVGRQLHLFAFGGARYGAELAACLGGFTIIDSTPFVKSTKRQRLAETRGRRAKWVKHSLPKETSIDKLLQHNIDSYATLIHNRSKAKNSRIGNH
jgi:hypothetical protein